MLDGVRTVKFLFVSATGEIRDREQRPKLLRASFGNTNRIKRQRQQLLLSFKFYFNNEV